MPWRVHDTSANPCPYGADDFLAMGHGVTPVGLLLLARSVSYRFSLQPFACAAAMGPPWMMDRYGLSIFLGWATSSLVLRLGGVRAHRGLRPSVFGLVCGNAIVLLAWSVYGLFRPMDGVRVIE